MKRYVLPTLKVLIALVVAIALIKIAFFPAGKDKNNVALDPSFSVATQTIAATVGDIHNTIDVQGKIVEDAAVQALATLAGSVEALSVDKGATVSQGDPLMTLIHSEPQPQINVLAADHRYKCPNDGETACEMIDQPDKVTREVVYAPASGTVTFNVIKDQETSVGMVVASVAPGTYSAVGTITPSQQYQLLSAPTQALITLDGGPAPFTCEGLTIGTKTVTASNSNTDETANTAPADGTSVEVRCPMPADQKVFPGLPATIGIDAGSATGVVMVPTTAVEGSTTTGNVWVVTDPSNPDAAEKREVTLGVNDGTNVEIKEGLAEGDEVLLFVPGKDVTRTGEPNTCDQYACYDENGQEVK